MKRIKESFSRLISDDFGRIQLTVFLLVLILNCLTALTADDLGYKINSGLFDIFRREYIQYMTWTGRTTAHLIARTFLAMPKSIFNIANSWCFCHLCTLIMLHGTGNREDRSAVLYLITVLLVFLFAPLFGQTCLWETGSCNYLWTTMIILQFLWNYRTADAGDNSAHNILLMFLAGIPAGWTNENTGGALILLILYFMFCAYRKGRVKGWMLSGLAGSVLGFLMLLKAPGNKIRALDFVNTNGRAYELIHDFYGVLEVFQDGQTWLWIFLAALLGVMIWKKKYAAVQYSAAYAAAGAAAVGAIMLSPVPVLYDRSMFGASILLIIAVMVCVSVLQKEDYMQKEQYAWIGIMMLFACFNYLRSIADIGYTRYQINAREQYVQAQKDQGNVNPVIPLVYNEFQTPYNAMFGLGDLSEYRTLWINTMYAEAHGIESVQTTSLERWNRIYRSGDPTLMNITDLSAYLNEAVKGNRTILINSGKIDSDAYSEFLSVLKDSGMTIPEQNTLYLCGVIENGEAIKQTVSDQPAELDGNAGESYYYISSQPDAQFSDILVDGLEYTNDNPGISIVVYDRDLGRVTDSVTWNTESDQGGIRYYIEQ